MTHAEARNIAIKYLRNDVDCDTDPEVLNEAADVLDQCDCKEDFSDGTAVCRQCGRAK